LGILDNFRRSLKNTPALHLFFAELQPALVLFNQPDRFRLAERRGIDHARYDAPRFDLPFGVIVDEVQRAFSSKV